MVVLRDDLVIVLPVGFEEAVDIALCELILSRHSHGPAHVPQPTVIAMGIVDDKAVIFLVARVNWTSVFGRVATICLHGLDMVLSIRQIV